VSNEIFAQMGGGEREIPPPALAAVSWVATYLDASDGHFLAGHSGFFMAIVGCSPRNHRKTFAAGRGSERVTGRFREFRDPHQLLKQPLQAIRDRIVFRNNPRMHR
jgi:hypothetical protein